MADPRTSDGDVRKILPSDTPANADFELAIRTATDLVDYVVSLDTTSVLSVQLQRSIETWLAAHYYAIFDPQYQQKRTQGASAVFQGKTDMGLQSTHWGQQAMVLDVTGRLADLNQQSLKGKRRAGVTWLGKDPADQDNT